MGTRNQMLWWIWMTESKYHWTFISVRNCFPPSSYLRWLVLAIVDWGQWSTREHPSANHRISHHLPPTRFENLRNGEGHPRSWPENCSIFKKAKYVASMATHTLPFAFFFGITLPIPFFSNDPHHCLLFLTVELESIGPIVAITIASVIVSTILRLDRMVYPMQLLIKLV